MPRPKITRVSNFQVSPFMATKNNGLCAPSLATDEIEDAPGVTPDNGEIYYNTAFKTARIRLDNVWVNLNTSNAEPFGSGLAAGDTPLVYPSGAKAAVEIADNQVNGFTYYDTTNNRVRCYANALWKTVTLVTEA